MRPWWVRPRTCSMAFNEARHTHGATNKRTNAKQAGSVRSRTSSSSNEASQITLHVSSSDCFTIRAFTRSNRCHRARLHAPNNTVHETLHCVLFSAKVSLLKRSRSHVSFVVLASPITAVTALPPAQRCIRLRVTSQRI